MANWNKQRVNAEDVNNGQKFRPIDGLSYDDVNKIFESTLYTQDVIENISASATSGTQANVNVNYDSQGHIILDFTLPKGDKGDKGEPGSGAETLEPLVNKNLYNLGAYDTISGNTITRQTGYLALNGSENWTLANTIGYLFQCEDYKAPLDNQFVNNKFNVSNAITMWTNTTQAIAFDTNRFNLRIDNITTVTDLKSYLSANNIYIQYKLATPYTEEIIENQPLNTLDQQGSQWVREEWEKGLNLFDLNCQKENNNASYQVINDTIVVNGNGSSQWDNVRCILPVKPNTQYTLSLKNSYAQYVYIYDGSNSTPIRGDGNPAVTELNYTFTTPSGCYILWIQFYDSRKTGNTVSNIMLNEGNHAYPYQEYNGAIIHNKDLEPKLLWENPNPNIIEYPNTTLNNMGALLNYKYLIFEYKDSSNDATTYFQKVKIAKTGISTILIYNANAVNTTFYSREVYFDASDNSLEFDTCYVSTADSTNNVSNAYIIPIAIYGTNLL